MSEQKQPSTHEKNSARSTHEGRAPAAPGAWRRLLAKKWVFPAVYMAAAAIILTLLWVYQNSGATPENSVDAPKVTQEQGKDGETQPVNAGVSSETLRLPFADEANVEVVRPFFDSEADNEAKQAAVVQTSTGEYSLHTGVDYAAKDNQPFDVVAALSGIVTRAETDPVAGKLVEITHPDGLITVYQSLTDVMVAKGAEVKQGDKIASAGRSELERDLGYHVHFEVRQSDTRAPLNPAQYLQP